MKIYENLRCKELKDLSDDALRLEANKSALMKLEKEERDLYLTLAIIEALQDIALSLRNLDENGIEVFPNS